MGYGSNMSLDNFKQFKNIQIISHSRGIIKDWKLSFSLCYPTKSFANIHISKGDEVHGVIMRLKQSDLSKLQTLERSYRLQTVSAYLYKNRISKAFNVWTFVFDQQCEERIKCEIKNDKNVKQVIRFFDKSGGGKKPEKNYLNTILRGANELNLDREYIQKLEKFESLPIVKYNPTMNQLQRINDKIWNASDIEQFIFDNPNECVSIFKGIVLDMANYPPSWKQMVNGKDITMKYAKRWAFGNSENCKTTKTLENEQKIYLNGELQKLLNGLYGVRILGKMNKKNIQIC